jgi:proteasome lid subunit RPN8/RPN11
MKYQIVLKEHFGLNVLAAAQNHARAEFPNESCGFIARSKYYPCKNTAEDPTKSFEIDDARLTTAITGGKLKAIVHSHPNGPIYPTEWDMRQQIAFDAPFLIVTLNDTDFGEIVGWGDDLPMVPVLERPFIHGVFDCYSLIRDTFRLGREELLKQGIAWPLDPILLPEVPRDDNWWQKSDDDLYTAHFKKFGFHQIKREEAKPGDIFMIAVGDARANPKKRINHAGMLIGGGLLLQHLPARLSRREGASLWARAADMWIRHESAGP